MSWRCEHLLDPLEVARRGQQHAAGAHDRLGEERGDRVGAFALDQRLEVVDHARAERALALARLGEPVPVWAAGMEEALQRQVPGAVVDRDAGEAGGGAGQPVIAAEARDDLLLRRLSPKVVVVADQLDVGVVGIRARAAEKDPGKVAGASMIAEQREDAIGETDDRLARGRAEDVVIVEVLDRLLRRFGDLGPAITDVDAPETGAAVDQLAPLVVLDAHTPAALDDQRPVAHVGGDRGERMEQALPVHLLERVVRFLLEHSLPPLGRATARSSRLPNPKSITGGPRWPEAPKGRPAGR